MVVPPLCIVIQVRLDLQPDRSEAAKPRRDCAGWAALDNTKRATRRQEDGVADDVAYHVVAHHVASHGDDGGGGRLESAGAGVRIACSPMRTGGRPMCSGASSFMWEAAAQHFQVVGAL